MLYHICTVKLTVKGVLLQCHRLYVQIVNAIAVRHLPWLGYLIELFAAGLGCSLQTVEIVSASNVVFCFEFVVVLWSTVHGQL